MATFSLHRKKGSPYYFAVFRIPDDSSPTGWRQTSRSTRRKSKTQAEAVGRDLAETALAQAGAGDTKSKAVFDIVAEAAAEAARGILTEASGRRYIERIVEVSTGQKLARFTTREWLDHWLANQAGNIAPATLTKRKYVVNRFLESLPEGRADSDIAAVTRGDILALRDELRAEGRRASTVNTRLAILKSAFADAMRDGLILANPALAIRNLKNTEEDNTEKAVIAPSDIARLLSAAEGDWIGLILAGYFVGGSVGDMARLKWGQVDLVKGTITYRRKKSTVPVVSPIHPELGEWLIERPAPDSPDAPVFPTLAEKRPGGTGGLSDCFSKLLKKAAISGEVFSPLDSATGESHGRKVSSLTFHSLRHTFNSALANAGVESEEREALMGHSSAKMNLVYTKRKLSTLADAVGKLPRVSDRKENDQ